jgi:hypothetical protein
MTGARKERLESDAAYVRALAEEGAEAPLVGGVLYVIWGLVIAVASLVGFLNAYGIVAMPLVGGVRYWLAAFILGWLATFAFGRRVIGKPGALTVGNRTAAAAWLAVGVFLSLFWIAAMIFGGRLRTAGVEPQVIFGLMFPVAFGVYGIAFYATAVAARLSWMRGFALAAWLFFLAALYHVGDARQLLVGAAGSLICAVLPGFLLMRQEPSEIV